MTDCLLFDVDGTLVDTNYLHTVAWHRAFLRFDLVIPNWRIHRAIGMGGDQLVPYLTGDSTEASLGEQIRQAWSQEYQPLIDLVRPFEGAHSLLAAAANSADRAALVGDSVWDCEAATRSGLAAVGVLTGGTCRAELLHHGAAVVYEHPDQLREGLQELPLTQVRSRVRPKG